MKWFKNKYAMLFLSLLVACTEKNERAVAEPLPYFNEASFLPNWISQNSDSLKVFHKIPPFSLINQDSTIITEKTLEGKIYVANFFFTTCPGICPQMTDNMGILQEKYLEDNKVMLLSHSVTPTRDTVEKLKGYASKREIKSKTWHLLTGDREQIYSLGRNAYFIEENMGIEKTVDDFLHTENFVLIDTQKYIRGIYNGLNKTSIRQLMADIETLKSEG